MMSSVRTTKCRVAAIDVVYTRTRVRLSTVTRASLTVCAGSRPRTAVKAVAPAVSGKLRDFADGGSPVGAGDLHRADLHALQVAQAESSAPARNKSSTAQHILQATGISREAVCPTATASC